MRSPRPLPEAIRIALLIAPLAIEASGNTAIVPPKQAAVRPTEFTLFGLPYAVESGATVVIGRPPTKPQKPAAAAKTVAPPAASLSPEPTTVVVPLGPRRVDYSKALNLTPFEQIGSETTVIDGKRFRTGEAFSLTVPMGAIAADRRDDLDTTPVICTFLIKSIQDGTVSLQVLPHPDYPAKALLLAYRFQP